MSLFVVESPVAVKWFIPEEHSSHCSRLIDGGHELLAADTLTAETARIVTAKLIRDEISPEEAAEVMTALRSSPVALQSSEKLLAPAMEIAFIFDRRLDDGINLSLAVQHDCRLVTAQRELFETLQGTPFATYIKWVGDIR